MYISESIRITSSSVVDTHHATVFSISRALFLLVAICLASQLVGAQTNIPAELIDYPDFVFYNGQVLTGDKDKDFTIAQAVAVRGNRILTVGTSEQLQKYIGPKTRAIDLKGRSLTAGFIYNDGDNSVPAGDILKDSQWGGLTRPHVGGKTLDEALATLAKIVETEGKPGEPIYINLQDTWSGTAMNVWDIDTLNEVAPNNPVIVFLESSEGVMNQAMIDLAIKEGFPPNHLHMGKDKNGKYNGRAGAQLVGFIGREVRPWPDPIWFDEVGIPAAVKSLANYAKHGVTVATGHMSAPTMTILNRMFHEDPKTLAVRVYPGLDFLRQNPNGEMYLKRMGNLVDFTLEDERGAMVTIVGASVGPHAGTPDGLSGLLSIHPKKVMIPGLAPNPNGDNRWTGEWMNGLSQDELTPEQMKQTDFYNVMLARQHGWNVTGIHNMGSQGIRLAMQNIIAAENQPKLYVKKLWRPQGFDHNIQWEPEIFTYYDTEPVLQDVVRFGISLRTMVAQRDSEPLGIKNLIEAQYGMEGLEKMVPLRTLLQKGIKFHIEGTEPHDKEMYPTWYMQKAENRVDRNGRVIAANEALDRESAFLALTRWAARFIGSEKDMGSIQPGMLADLVVFDGDIMAAPVEKLADIRAVLTLVGGQVAYDSPEL